MNISKPLLAAAILATCATAHAAPNDWVNAVDTKGMRVDLKRGSFAIESLADPEARRQAVLFTGAARLTYKNDRTSEFYRVGVRSDHCSRGEGMLAFYEAGTNEVASKADGSPFVFTFSFGGGTNASNIAEALCDAGAEEVAERSKSATKPAARPAGRVTPI
jgi:hypothetical protein